MRQFLKRIGTGITRTLDDPATINLAALGACVFFAHKFFGMNAAILVGMCLLYVRLIVKGKVI